MKLLEKCQTCPRDCKVNRLKKEIGLCGADDQVRVAKIALHYGEEPPISLENGSGAIFFSGCNLKCIFCQNYSISSKIFGKILTIQELADQMIELQKKKAANINLVTPTHYIPQIIEAIKIAKKKGLRIPIIYNCGGYEKVESLKLLNGLIDIYLPDLKYYDDLLAMKYSKAPNYFEIATKAIREMYRQVGVPKFDQNGMLKKGIIVRHLLLPEQLEDSKRVIRYLYHTYQDKVFISIMGQYTPLRQVQHIKELNHRVKREDYDALIRYACDLNIKNAFIQNEGSDNEEFIPYFDLSGV